MTSPALHHVDDDRDLPDLEALFDPANGLLGDADGISVMKDDVMMLDDMVEMTDEFLEGVETPLTTMAVFNEDSLEPSKPSHSRVAIAAEAHGTNVDDNDPSNAITSKDSALRMIEFLQGQLRAKQDEIEELKRSAPSGVPPLRKNLNDDFERIVEEAVAAVEDTSDEEWRESHDIKTRTFSHSIDLHLGVQDIDETSALTSDIISHAAITSPVSAAPETTSPVDTPVSSPQMQQQNRRKKRKLPVTASPIPIMTSKAITPPPVTLTALKTTEMTTRQSSKLAAAAAEAATSSSSSSNNAAHQTEDIGLHASSSEAAVKIEAVSGPARKKARKNSTASASSSTSSAMIANLDEEEDEEISPMKRSSSSAASSVASSESTEDDDNSSSSGLDASGKKKTARRWTPEQDEMLRNAVEKHNGQNWKAIANLVQGRDHVQCLQRWKKVLQPGLVKGMWRKSEDDLLLELMSTTKPKNWADVAQKIPGRTAKQCRERWSLNLDPSINRGAWTQAEDELLLKLHYKLGNRWAEIKRHLKGRTENGVKTRFKSIERAKAKDQEVTWTAELEKQLHDICVRFDCKIDEVAKHLPRALRGISSQAMREHCKILRDAETRRAKSVSSATAQAIKLPLDNPLLNRW